MTDYALRLLMHVARQDGRLSTIAEVAARYGISEAHLMKITHQLALAGLLRTQRGKGGGMCLARAPSQITVGEVVRLVEADFALVECFAAGTQCSLAGACRLAGVLDGARRAFLEHLDRTTLEELVA